MGTITGTKRGVTIVRRTITPDNTLGVYLVTADFAAYTGSSDDAALAGVGAYITASVRDGKCSSWFRRNPRRIRWGLHSLFRCTRVQPDRSGEGHRAYLFGSDDRPGQLRSCLLRSLRFHDVTGPPPSSATPAANGRIKRTNDNRDY